MLYQVTDTGLANVIPVGTVLHILAKAFNNIMGYMDTKSENIVLALEWYTCSAFLVGGWGWLEMFMKRKRFASLHKCDALF